MVDLYTNAIMACARALVGLAGGAAVNPLVSLGIKTLGRFVQAFSEVAISEDYVPGLAAMQPANAIAKELNEAPDGLERLAAYYAVTSNFVARLEPAKGVTKELAEFVIDRVTNRLFQLDNDLVVDTSSMVSFGTRNARLQAGDTFAFGSTDEVYHTIYFADASVPLQLSEWLGFSAQPSKPSRSRELNQIVSVESKR
jgi:plastocyanin